MVRLNSLPKLLLDANLSPKTAKFLALTFGFDVISLLDLGLGEISDRDVVQFDRETGRVIVTLDEDFARP